MAVTKQTANRSKPPPIREVSIYFNQKGMPALEAEQFYEYYQKQHWTSKNGNAIEDWKSFACRWIAAVIHDQPLLFDREIH